jgi:hypothetical protein
VSEKLTQSERETYHDAILMACDFRDRDTVESLTRKLCDACDLLEQEAALFRHLESLAVRDGNGGDWIIDVWPKGDDFRESVESDMRRVQLTRQVLGRRTDV